MQVNHLTSFELIPFIALFPVPLFQLFTDFQLLLNCQNESRGILRKCYAVLHHKYVTVGWEKNNNKKTPQKTMQKNRISECRQTDKLVLEEIKQCTDRNKPTESSGALCSGMSHFRQVYLRVICVSERLFASIQPLLRDNQQLHVRMKA